MNELKYGLKYDLHTHTVFSHGKGSIEENVAKATKIGLEKIGITDHGPGHLFFGIKRKNIQIMRNEIERLTHLYPKTKILLGVEANIVNGGNNLDITNEEAEAFDFIIAGYHFGVLNGNMLANYMHNVLLKILDAMGMPERINLKLMNKNTQMVVKAIKKNNIAVLTHPGDKGPFDLVEIAKACAKKGTLMEISTWHKHLTVEEIRLVAETGVNFVINSDAHKPERIGEFQSALERAILGGIDLSRIVNLYQE